MDDGSASTEESRQLLNELSAQGVTLAAATPHFYPDREKPADFFARRERAFASLGEQKELPVTLLPGAEVYFYPGISQTGELPAFTIGKTGLLLLEMPFCDWTPFVVREVMSIRRDRSLRVVIAHIDRYLSAKNSGYFEDLHRNGVLFQLNASALLDRKRRAAALELLESHIVQFIGSDCHNMQTRAPKLREAYDVVEKKLGADAAGRIQETSRSFFEDGDG